MPFGLSLAAAGGVLHLGLEVGAVGSDVRSKDGDWSSLAGWRGAKRELISQGRVMLLLFTGFDVLCEMR